MKNAWITAAALVIVTGCSQPTENAQGSGAEVANASAAEIAANTRPDGSVIDESRPHEHSDATAHAEPMDGMTTMATNSGDSAATKGYKQAMTRMMQGMPPYTGDADVDFNKQMRTHHLSAIDMAKVQLANGKDAESRALATKVIADQEREIAQIDAWLAKRGQ